MKQMENEHKRQAQLASTPTPGNDTSSKRASMARFQNASDDAASPSAEASHDPAPTRHEPLTEADRVLEKGKYETAQPYRPPSGNRFSWSAGRIVYYFYTGYSVRKLKNRGLWDKIDNLEVGSSSDSIYCVLRLVLALELRVSSVMDQFAQSWLSIDPCHS
jgi:hypothetical protein